MLYRPPDRILWDTFLLRHQAWFHLFHLRGGKTLGHARSRDLLHWDVRPAVDLVGPPGAWNAQGAPWTGCIVRHEDRFLMLVGGPGPAGIPGYGLLASDDLDHWEQLSRDPVLVPQSPHYRRRPSNLHVMHAAWRDPCVVKVDEWYHAFLCARSPDWSADDTGALVAHLRSEDLEHWEHLPPIARVGERVQFAEVPDVFRMGDWWYLLFLDHGWGGTRINSAARSDMAGTFYVRSPSLEGPYRWPKEPLLIGTGGDRMGPWAARTITVEGQRWLYFHHAGAQPAFGLPKRVEQTDDGDLCLSYLPLTEPVEDELEVNPAEAVLHTKPRDLGHWNESRGVVAAHAKATGTAVVVADDVPHVRLTCEIKGEGAARAGVVVRSTGSPGADLFEQDNTGLVVWLDFERGRLVAERRTWVPGSGWGQSVLGQMGHATTHPVAQQVRLKLPARRWLRLRLMLRDRFLEVYLGDRWMLSLDTEDHPQTGRVELTVERGAARFRALSIASLPPLTDAVGESGELG
jgi:beta-fructofuranosidase